ncbi:hypothetical protein VOLCADRAFT_98154 [Volvox carteri f. nagariensis]|uniref:Calpain catalytic domain-containing protein n=1 Tax=Volvox carteri f. nagariensis TaxID=3068 RepID=D8UEL0_VOLCA|nr:uncharacterized protein VOLCADRAFT_98154 [Volvox carteri f. nagariensis]EFJ41862.1 hypothetical protein VOLCADRAFT_98154 [Volvox carteri f. nagariensis]|eukprot:XP_002957060.1 hypothetical protein VOLCADRAFT_98154 [Volvox carteri f. nagariensis]
MYISDRALPPEDVTVNTIEGLLRIPSLASGRTEEQLVASYCGEDGLVIDPDFPPGISSLRYPDVNQPPASAPSNVTWRRVSGTLYFPTGKTPRLLQVHLMKKSGWPMQFMGVLDSGAFLGALAAVAASRGGELLLDLIVSDDAAPHGAYTFQFFKHGCWQAVVVDNYLPCVSGEERLAFACSAVVGELWPSLLEKAYAKVHGSYYALSGGCVHEALVDLTGGVGFKLKTDTGVAAAAIREGSLWADMQNWLAAKSIIACVARRKGPARNRFRPDAPASPTGDGEGNGAPLAVDDAEGGPYGLQYNQVYSVLEVRAVGESIQLVRLHCPWPKGMWNGPWALGSPQWDIPAVASHLEAFRATWDDEATFWMPFADFAAIFNRIHVCRMFPPSWHQLTLHCGWQGPSAGGPYHLQPPDPAFPATGAAPAADRSPSPTFPAGGGGGGGSAGSSISGAGERPNAASAAAAVSSTWCCNPQFRLTVRKTCEVVVCLGQQDPTVSYRSHVPKRHRKRAIGLQVLKVPLEALGRRWEIRPGEVVASLPLSTGREVVASFRASPDFAYVVVPHAGRAGEEGAFILRSLSASPLEVEQLPAPLCLVVGGQWTGYLTGGNRHCPPWGSNPQYMVSCSQRAQVVASLTRLDLKYALIKAPRDPALDLDLVLAHPEQGPDGPGRRTAVRDSDLLASAAQQQLLGSNEEVVMSVVLEPETPYVLVPSIATPGVEGPYELRLMSGVPLELVPLPEMQSVQLPGEWSSETAGGCNVNPLWRRNPKYYIVLASFGRVRITLSRVPSRKPRHPVDDMLGLYILRAAGADGEIKVTIKITNSAAASPSQAS